MTQGEDGPARVLVLGASGFVGGAIMRALAATPGLRPVAGVRRPRGGSWAEERVCDATDAPAVDRAVQGIPLAVCSVLGSPEAMKAATQNLCDAALRAGMRRIVFISSMAVYGRAEGLVDEAAPLDGDTAYGKAKVGCEQAVQAFAAAGGAATILRPGIVYGPDGEQWVGRIGRLLRAGRLGDLGVSGDGFCNLIYNDDVGAAVAAALARPAAAGEAFNLADPDPPTWNEFLTDFSRAIGVPCVRRVPAWQLQAEATLLAPPLQAAKVLARRLGLRRPGFLPEPVPPSLLRVWRQRIRLDHRKADALLGFPRTPRPVGLAASADWFLTREGDTTGRRPPAPGRRAQEIQA